MPTRAERRAAAREAAKLLLQHPPEKKGFRWDSTLALVGVAIGIVIVLAPPHTSRSAALWLLILFAVLVYPALYLAGWLLPTKPKPLKYSGSILLLAIITLGLGKAVMPGPSVEPKLSCQVETVQFEPVYRFSSGSTSFQTPPVYFQRLDTSIRISLMNQLGKPVYLQNPSAATLVGKQWVEFKNADSAAFEPYAFGLIGIGENKAFLSRYDLSSNGFDYVMQQGPLKADENRELWMFFISGISRDKLPDVSQFKFVFHDRAGEEFQCSSPYSVKADKGTIVGTNRGDLKVMPMERIPPNLREEPPH
jgi:hypothetical protein